MHVDFIPYSVKHLQLQFWLQRAAKTIPHHLRGRPYKETWTIDPTLIKTHWNSSWCSTIVLYPLPPAPRKVFAPAMFWTGVEDNRCWGSSSTLSSIPLTFQSVVCRNLWISRSRVFILFSIPLWKGQLVSRCYAGLGSLGRCFVSENTISVPGWRDYPENFCLKRPVTKMFKLLFNTC